MTDSVTVQERCAIGERLNIAPSGKRFASAFIEPGLVSYKDSKDGKVELLRKETIEEALNSIVGTPLTIKHPRRPWTAEQVANGYVDKAGHDAQSGWFVCEGTVETERARSEIRANAGPSCGYDVLELGPGGVWHNIPYDREITKIKFHHLALVGNPRYEDANIRLNAKGSTMMPKWIQKIVQKVKGADGVETEQTEERVNELPLTTEIDLGNGKKATLAQLIEKSRDNAVQSLSKDDEIEVDGQRVNVGALVSRFNELETADAAAADAAKKKQEEDEAARQNSIAEKAAAEKKAADELAAKERVNAGQNSFRILGSARNSQPAQGQNERQNSSESPEVQLRRGIERYGRHPATPGAN